MKIYISGKISGLPIEQARAHFQAAEDFLLTEYPTPKFAVVPINPMKQDHSKAADMEEAAKSTDKEIWAQYMATDIKALLTCDGIYMLRNWLNSTGARIEYIIAIEMGLTITFEI